MNKLNKWLKNKASDWLGLTNLEKNINKYRNDQLFIMTQLEMSIDKVKNDQLYIIDGLNKYKWPDELTIDMTDQIDMNIYELAIAKSTPEEVAKLVQDMADETEKYRKAFYAAKGFIDSHVADPDMTDEMIEKYREYEDAMASL